MSRSVQMSDCSLLAMLVKPGWIHADSVFDASRVFENSFHSDVTQATAVGGLSHWCWMAAEYISLAWGLVAIFWSIVEVERSANARFCIKRSTDARRTANSSCVDKSATVGRKCQDKVCTDKIDTKSDLLRFSFSFMISSPFHDFQAVKYAQQKKQKKQNQESKTTVYQKVLVTGTRRIGIRKRM